ncbi:MAG: amidohydrolase [Sphingomonadales bacterium]
MKVKQFKIGVVSLIGTFLIIQSANALDELDNAIEKDYPYLEALYKHLHQNPELSYYEKESSKRMATELRSVGFDVTENVGGYGIVGVLKNGEGPTVMIRADMDALPVKEVSGVPYPSLVTTVDDLGKTVPVMHACGHDVHMTVFVGTARRLVALKDTWKGTLVMVGQPAEERSGGARAMLGDGLFEKYPKPDYNIGLHTSASLPAGHIGYVKGWAMASVDSVDIKVHGIGGHGAYPHATKDPIIVAAQIVSSLQTLISRETSPLDSGVVTVGSIHGGFKHNIISDQVDLQLTVRSYSDKVRENLLSGIERISKNIARANGLPENLLPEVNIPRDEYTPSLYNTPELADRIVNVITNKGSSLGVHEVEPVMAGEDFARYGRTEDKIPTLLLWLGGVEPEKYEASLRGDITLPSLHSPFFAPLPEPTLKVGVNTMVISALELLGELVS